MVCWTAKKDLQKYNLDENVVYKVESSEYNECP